MYGVSVAGLRWGPSSPMPIQVESPKIPLRGCFDVVGLREDRQLVVRLHEAVEAAPYDIDYNAAIFSLMHVGYELWWLGALHEGLVGLEAEATKQQVLVLDNRQGYDFRLLDMTNGKMI